MKTIVITSNTSWYLYNFRKNTILALLNEGYRVVAVSPEDEYSEKLKSLGANYQHIYIDQGGANPLKDIVTFFSFVNLYRKIKPDVVLNFTPKNNIYSTLAGCLFGAKAINNIAGLGMVFIHENIKAKLARFLYKVSQPKAHTIFFQNEDDREIFRKYDLASMEITARVPGSGVDLSRFKIAPSPDDGVTRFLLIARMLYDKGIGHYVEAARDLRAKHGSKVEFRLLGFLDVNNPSAVSKQEMQAWEDEGIISYLGVSDSVEKEIAEADCVVLPSFYREGVPKSLLEACALGKPIVTTDNVGCRETVEDGLNGFLCEPRSTSSLINKLERMITLTYERRLAMGQQSRVKVEKEFDEQIVINRYLQAVKSAIQ
ncbi:TPA: glycosyltransferase family 4 protein [Vibrio parahaemolyticus]|uniref:glycosyltransferase family 4 protein n=1 Tax=Vibrio parahaemolyticus TaxID=670 RepID=UPI00112013D9|nr:glycosyltransferase family 4 protein [Vibrio parahaemolyticus]EJL6404086.1 glycosyltransferase family 4 protein [Vibrio parahaemolyticus]ELZ7232626.1 glycosyltransferase family 4 protein [Vibrio parahaemolyticus]MDF5654330.1 glycosyltransferase family 4 protein [Vibrio parahaemolyticus]TOG42275.1 glycosyl transferase family 1 [Vibrio parahaemolyticus]HBC3353711.1 glycosyltransferase family 4 protein [Vibrio parahaemolyticus]